MDERQESTWYDTICDNKLTTFFFLLSLSDLFTDLITASTMNVPVYWRFILFLFVLAPFGIVSKIIWDRENLLVFCLNTAGAGFRKLHAIRYGIYTDEEKKKEVGESLMQALFE